MSASSSEVGGRAMAPENKDSKDPSPDSEYWISCRFCCHTYPSSEISKLKQHEQKEHMKECVSNKKANNYKIFEMKGFQVDARPTHPLLKTIMKLNQLCKNNKSSSATEGNDQAPQPINTQYESIPARRTPDMAPAAAAPSVPAAPEPHPPTIPSPVPILSSYTANEDRTCTYCHRCFKFPSVLRLHLKTCFVYKNLQKDATTTSCGQAPAAAVAAPISVDAVQKPQQDDNNRTDDAHTCSICFKYFIDPTNLRKHLVLHGSLGSHRGLPCKFCMKQFRNSILLQQHIDTCHDKNLPYNCIHCDTKSSSQLARNDHVREIHSHSSTPSTTKSTSPVGPSSNLICELCSTVCLNKMELISHRAIVHQITVQPLSSNTTSENIELLVGGEQSKQVESATNSKNFNKCPHCDATFSSFTGTQLHISRRHKGSKEEGYPCRFCNKRFDSRAGTKMHEKRKHRNQRRRNRLENEKEVEGQQTQSASQGIKWCFCPLWYSDKTKRTIHEKRHHTDELATMLKEKQVMKRRNSTDQLLENAPSITNEIELPSRQSVINDDDQRILSEEIEVEVKPECLVEYMDESGGPVSSSSATAPPTMSTVQESQAQSAPFHQSLSNSTENELQLISRPVRVPLQVNRPAMEATDPISTTNTESAAGTGSGEFWCQFCQERFVLFLQLQMHLDRHSYCGTCEEKFNSSIRYRQHLLSDHDRVRKLFCQICCSPFIDLYAYRDHIKLQHGHVGLDSTPTAPTSQQPVSVSSVTPTTSAAAVSITSQRLPQYHPAAAATRGPVPCGCSLCGHTFPTVEDLKMHFMTFHQLPTSTEARAVHPVPVQASQLQPQMSPQSYPPHSIQTQQFQPQPPHVPTLLINQVPCVQVQPRPPPPSYQQYQVRPSQCFQYQSHQTHQSAPPYMLQTQQVNTSNQSNTNPTADGSGMLVCGFQTCDVQTPNHLPLVKHKIYCHNFSATAALNSMNNSSHSHTNNFGKQPQQQQSVIVSQTVPVPLPQIVSNQLQHTQLQHQDRSQRLEITQVRFVSNARNQTQNPVGGGAGSSKSNEHEDCVIINEQRSSQPQIQMVQNTESRQQEQRGAVLQLEEFLRNRINTHMSTQPPATSTAAPNFQPTFCRPPTTAAIPANSMPAPALPATSAQSQSNSNSAWCPYCQTILDSHVNLLQHCVYVHKVSSPNILN